MKSFFSLVLLLIVSTILANARAADGIPLWTNRYSGPGDNLDWATSVAVDASNDVIVAGYSALNHSASGSLDFLTIKYSNAGIPLWTNRYDGFGSDQTVGMVVDVNRNVIVTGISGGNETDDDYVTIKYSSVGTALWTNRYAGPGNATDWPVAVAVDNSGNVFVTGFSSANASFTEYVTLAYSDSGAPLWTNHYSAPGSGVNRPEGIAVDHDGNVFVTGSTYWFFTRSYYSTIKYSGEGIPLWTNRYTNGDDDAAVARGIAVDGNDNVIVTGRSYGEGTDYATIKYSNDGLPLWTNRYNGSQSGFNDEPYALGTDANCNVFVTGRSFSDSGKDRYATLAYSSAGECLWTNFYSELMNIDSAPAALAVDPAGNVVVAGSSGNTNTYVDCLTIKYSNSGIPLWTNRYEDAAGFEDRANAIATDNYGNVYMTGITQSTNIQNSFDYITIKYSSEIPQTARLDFRISGNQLVLSWTNQNYVLQSSSSVSGTFTNIPEGVSPYTNNITGLQEFFRLRAE